MTLESGPLTPAVRQGRIQDFHLLVKGAQQIMCAHAHHERKAWFPDYVRARTSRAQSLVSFE